MKEINRSLLFGIIVISSVLTKFTSGSSFPGDTFPTCVEVLDVHPSPSSYLSELKFTVTFSRAVFQLSVTREAFLTPSIVDFAEILPVNSHFIGSSNRKKLYSFKLTSDERKIYRKVYFVVDGGTFYTVNKAYGGAWVPFVPVSIFGEYYLVKTFLPSNPVVIVPSPYCTVHLRRKLPDPHYDDPIKTKFDVKMIEENNRLIQKSVNTYELHISVAVFGVGSGSMTLPTRVKVPFRGINITVLIPKGVHITLKKQDLWYQIPVKTEIIHEVVERIYHSSFARARPIKPASKLPNKIPSDLMLTIMHGKDVELKTQETNNNIFYSIAYDKDKLGCFSYDGRIKVVSAKDIFGEKYKFEKKHKPYVTRQECKPKSKRTHDSGRGGHTFHAVEYGPFYRLVIPILNDTTKWRIKSLTKVKVLSKDVTEFVSFGGPDSYHSRIPAFLKEALSQYVVLIKSVSLKGNNMVFIPLDEGIFVPKDNLHDNCGGILLFKNMSLLKNDKTFCQKPFGYCIGLPFTSTTRFPVIPPFGVPEFSGWTNQSVKTIANGYITHPMSRHFSDEVTVPRALYHAKNKKEYIIISATDDAVDHISEIPISGVKILDSEFEFLDPNACNNIWKLEKSIKKETKLVANIYNIGEGGADVSALVKCTSALSVLPASGQQTMWIGPTEVGVMQYHLDASRATVTKEKEPHKCDMIIAVYVSVHNPAQNLHCSRIIVTYFGGFQHPCTAEDTQLPALDLKYFVLPVTQRKSSVTAIESFLQSSKEKDLVFIKAISISLTTPIQQEELISNLNELRVVCNQTLPVVLLTEEQLLNKAKLESLQSREKTNYNASNIIFYTDFLQPQRIYYFANSNWVSLQHNKSALTKCTIEVWANRPHRMCVSNPVKQISVFVPLVQPTNLSTELVVKGVFWYLESVYGKQTDEIMLALLACIVVSIFLYGITICSHGLLLVFHKKLPNSGKKLSLEKQLKKAVANDKKRWENPQMFLESGENGPFYILYEFKCTDRIDTENIQSLKVAGLLRLKDKEQQVMFGHVKKIYIDKNSRGHVLLQASSGMYLLKAENVCKEYSGELQLFYERQNMTSLIKKDEE